MYKSFGDLFMSVFKDTFKMLDKDYTYMFELVSPYNRIVVPYKKTDIYHIGSRNMLTLEEDNVDIGVKKPKVFDLNSEQDIINAAENLHYDKEGYVVVDKDYKRVKVKSPAYLAVHRAVSNKIMTKERALEIIMLNEQSEFLSYFPEYKEFFEKVEMCLEKYMGYLSEMEEDCLKWSKECSTQKEFALKAQEKYSFDLGYIFGLKSKKIKTHVDSKREYLEKIGTKQIIERLKLYE